MEKEEENNLIDDLKWPPMGGFLPWEGSIHSKSLVWTVPYNKNLKGRERGVDS